MGDINIKIFCGILIDDNLLPKNSLPTQYYYHRIVGVSTPAFEIMYNHFLWLSF